MSAGNYALQETRELAARVERLERLLQALIMATGMRPWVGDVKAWAPHPELDNAHLLNFDEAGRVIR